MNALAARRRLLLRKRAHQWALWFYNSVACLSIAVCALLVLGLL